MTPIRMSKIEGTTRTVLTYKDAFNRHEADTICALLRDDCIFEAEQDGIAYKGKEEIRKYFEGFFAKSPQAELKIEEIFGMGLRVILRWQMDSERGVDIFKFQGKLICERLTYRKE